MIHNPDEPVSKPKPVLKPKLEPGTAQRTGPMPESEVAGPTEPGSVEERLWRENLRLRARFLREVPTLSLDGPRQARLRERRLFAVEADGATLVPAFQLNALGEPRPVVGEILACLPSEWTSWQIAFWFVSGSGWLSGACPWERLDDREAVLSAAEQAANPAVG